MNKDDLTLIGLTGVLAVMFILAARRLGEHSQPDGR